MRVTHLGHACLLLEYRDERLLIDPGNLSEGFDSLTDLSAILVTHQHPDHLDPERLPGLVKANPQARLLFEAQTLDMASRLPGMAETATMEALTPGATVTMGEVAIRADGGRHAVIHQDIPRVGNVGILLSCEGEPTVFHPGDSLEVIAPGVDILGVPVSAPWCALKETVEFVRAVAAPRAIGIHDRVASEAGRGIYLGHIENLGGSQLVDLAPGEPGEF